MYYTPLVKPGGTCPLRRLLLLAAMFACGDGDDGMVPGETAGPFAGQWYLHSPVPHHLSATPSDTFTLYAAGIDISSESPIYNHPWGFYADSTVLRRRVNQGSQFVWQTEVDGWRYSTGEVQVRGDTLNLTFMLSYRYGSLAFFMRPNGTLGRLDEFTGLATNEVWVRGWPFAASRPEDSN